MNDLDPVTLAVLNGRLVQIADEMDATLYRSAFNPIIAEAHDACHGLYHAQTGATLVQGTTGLPIFVGAMAFAVKAVIDKAGSDGDLKPGDTYLFNDPYDGGTHLNDFRLVRPLLRERQGVRVARVGRALARRRRQRARKFQRQGDRKLSGRLSRAAGQDRPRGRDAAGHHRHPRPPIRACRSRTGATSTASSMRSISASGGSMPCSMNMATNRSWPRLRPLTARAEELMRANIARCRTAPTRYDDFLDNDGITDAPLRIALDLTIAGERMRLDFSRSSPPCDGPLNIARSTAVACCYVALKHMFTDVPANAGCLAPVEFVIPDTTLLGVSAPRPVGGYTETILRVIDVVFGAFAKAAPERANGSPFATINALSLAGWREHGQRWVMFCFFGGGLGGNPETDGLNHGNNPISTATIPPAEILESLYPVMFTQWALRPDSGGPGKHRGGLGAIYEIEPLADGDTDVFLLGERGKFPPFGVNGGKAAALNRFIYQTDDGEHTLPLVTKITDVRIGAGQRVRLETPGGGGFGDPLHARSAARRS